MATANSKKRSSWYLDDENFAFLQGVAKRDDRSMNQMLNVILRRFRKCEHCHPTAVKVTAK